MSSTYAPQDNASSMLCLLLIAATAFFLSSPFCAAAQSADSNLILNADFTQGDPPPHWYDWDGYHGNTARFVVDSTMYVSAPHAVNLIGKSYFGQFIDAVQWRNKTLHVQCWYRIGDPADSQNPVNTGFQVWVRYYKAGAVEMNSNIGRDKVVCKGATTPTDWAFGEADIVVPVDADTMEVLVYAVAGLVWFDDLLMYDKSSGAVAVRQPQYPLMRTDLAATDKWEPVLFTPDGRIAAGAVRDASANRAHRLSSGIYVMPGQSRATAGRHGILR